MPVKNRAKVKNYLIFLQAKYKQRQQTLVQWNASGIPLNGGAMRSFNCV